MTTEPTPDSAVETSYAVEWRDPHGDKTTCQGFASWLLASEYAEELPKGCTEVMVVTINKMRAALSHTHGDGIDRQKGT